MESPKRGCDLGFCVLKCYRSKNTLRSFLLFKDFPRGQSLRLGPLRSKNAAFCDCVLKPTKEMIVMALKLSTNQLGKMPPKSSDSIVRMFSWWVWNLALLILFPVILLPDVHTH